MTEEESEGRKPSQFPRNVPGAGLPPGPAAPALRGPTVPVTRGGRPADRELRPGRDTGRAVEMQDAPPRPAPRTACVWSTRSPERGGQAPRPGAPEDSTTPEWKAVSAGPSPWRGLRGRCSVLSGHRNLLPWRSHTGGVRQATADSYFYRRLKYRPGSVSVGSVCPCAHKVLFG